MNEESKPNAPECQSKAEDVVCIHYDDLVSASRGIQPNNTDIDDLIERAFSSAGLGIIAITNVPTLPQLRLRLLPLALKVASLPADQLEGITVPESDYQVGWSHGREKLQGDKLDYSKGSFYANPLTENLTESMLGRRAYQRSRQTSNSNQGDIDVNMEELLIWDESLQHIKTDDELCTLAQSNHAFFAPNIWPSKCPELESAFREVGQLVHEVGVIVAQCCDSYVSARCPGYEPKLEKILRHSKCCKGRLLHYFPTQENGCDNDTSNDTEDTQFSNWCGWHNDHGSLTGLLPALYLNSNGHVVDCPDANAGLYIKSRNGTLVHANIPENAIAFQVGETAQIHTGGLLQATPHAVRGSNRGNVSRETFAVFMEPEYHSTMNLPTGRTLDDTQCIEAEQWLPSSVKTLRSRWKLGMNFGDFSNATFSAFH